MASLTSHGGCRFGKPVGQLIKPPRASKLKNPGPCWRVIGQPKERSGRNHRRDGSIQRERFGLRGEAQGCNDRIQATVLTEQISRALRFSIRGAALFGHLPWQDWKD